MGILTFFRSRLQWRLMFYVLPLVIIPVVVLNLVITQLWQGSLTEEVVGSQKTILAGESEQIENFFEAAQADVKTLGQSPEVVRLAQTLLVEDVETAGAQRDTVEDLLLNFTRNHTTYFEVRYIDSQGNEIVRVDTRSGEVALTPHEGLQWKGDRPYYIETSALPAGETYVGPLNLNREGSPPTIVGTLTDGTAIPVLRYAVPVYVDHPETNVSTYGGIVIVNVEVQQIFDRIQLGFQEGNVLLLNKDGYYLLNSEHPERVFGFEDGIAEIGGVAGASIFDDFTEQEANWFITEDAVVLTEVGQGEGQHAIEVGEFKSAANDFVFFRHITPPGTAEGEQEWVFGLTRDESAFLATGNQIQRNALIFTIVLVIIGAGIVILLARRLTHPLTELGGVAGRLAEGDLTVRAANTIQREDEIGQLGAAFDNMANRLEEIVDSLEVRVAERTKDLARAVDVGSVVTRIYSQAEMLPYVTDFIRDNFGLYYTQIYMLDEAKRYAHLRAGTGDVGLQLLERQHRLDMNETSLVANAVHTGVPVLVEDTDRSTTHRKNPLLPDTRSELAVPLKVGDDILGVLDMQSAEPRTFNEENVPVFEAMASQLAASLKGAKAYDEAQKAIQHAEAIAQRLTGQKWQSYLGRLGAGEHVGYEYDLESPKPLDGSSHDGNGHNGDEHAVAVPIEVHGRQIGMLRAQDDQVRVWTDEEQALVRGIAEHVARAVEQFRAFDETEKRAAELHTVSQVSAAASRVRTLEDLLPRVANLTKESFGLYHAHIYLLDAESEVLELAAGAGEVGEKMVSQGHSIDLHNPTSLVARAARLGEGVIENDVAKSAHFLPNPMLPHTRAEMAVPMIVGEHLIGVLDVQSNTINRFTEEDVLVKTTLADQIAIAVQNARAFETEREAAERLREVDRLKSQFLANMSHELRTPLNSIIGYAEVLLDGIDGDLSEEAMIDVQDIHSSGKHLLAIINDILDLAKIEAGQMKMDAQELSLQDVVDDVVHTAQILVKEKPVNLQVFADPNPIMVEADPIRLRQVILNLVSNAVKFTEQGSVTIEVSRTSDREAVVKVIDTGIGLSEDGLAVIFERFSQVDGSATRRSDGTGLGLTITRELVQMHGGDIYAESEEGVGSTFWFNIPITVPAVVGE